MKKSLIVVVTAASAALLATAATAQTAGYVGANYEHSDFNPAGPGDQKTDSAQLQGSGAWNVSGVGVAVDGQITDVGGAGLSNQVDYALTAHVNTKVLGDNLVGGFAGAVSTTNLTFWGVGLEGQTKLGAQNVVYGQVGYGSSNDLGNPDVWSGRAELRHFYTDNAKVQASVGYLHAKTDIVTFDAWNAGLEGEYQFAGTPWSVLAGYDYSRSDKLDASNNTFRLGARYTFGGASLKARDEAGADLGSVRQLFAGAFGF
jgi:hypothetical protein